MGKKYKEKKSDKEKEDESVAGGILEGIGEMIPGLGGLVKSLGKSPAFKERLKKIDEEVERRLKESPLRSGGDARASRIGMGIPPGARGKAAKRKRFVKERSEPRRRQGPAPVPKERPVDIFDEKDYVKIIAEIPGVEESDIKIGLVKDSVAISVDIPGRKYHQKLKLPCEPKGELEKCYKNGILEVEIRKV